jgi:hypothetical protein
MLKPTLGRIVLYRTDGRNGLSYDLPAIITCTEESHAGDYPDGTPNDLPVPRKEDVHLTVFTPGQGHYVEISVPMATDVLNPSPRSWRWPERV